MKARNICRHVRTFSPPLEGFPSRVSSSRSSLSPATNLPRSDSTASQRPRTSASDLRSVPWATAGFGRLQPAMQPHLLRPHDVGERALNPPVAALQGAEKRLVPRPGGAAEERGGWPAAAVD